MRPPKRHRGSTALRWALTSLVLAVAAGATFVIVLSVTRSVFDPAGDGPTLPLFATAASVGVAVSIATGRRIDSAVVDLIDGVDDQQIAAIAVIEHDIAAEFGPNRYLAELAATAASLLRVPFVRFDIDPVAGTPRDESGPAPEVAGWSSALSASHGSIDDTRRLVDRPVRLGALDIGRITVGSRTGGNELTEHDLAAVNALARQAAMAISNARHAEALHRSRERAVSGIEEERRRLRRDLHDELGPNLAAMKLRLGVLRRVGGLTPTATAIVDDLARDVDATTADVRRLVENLRPPLLDDLGLSEALRCLAFVPDDLCLTIESTDGLESLPAATQVALYRIGSEAIRNVVRHADATSCAVRLTRTPDAVTLTVIDDGRGITDDRPPGVGIASMNERADELGGLVTISAGIDQHGCCVAATIPLLANVAQPLSDSATEPPT